MEYKGNVLTFDNYKMVLPSGFDTDILDEVRSALMDSLDITPWLDECKDDPYRLQQIRVGMKEGIAYDYFSLSAGVIRRIRNMLKSGVNMDQLDPWISARLPRGHYDHIMRWIESGYVIPEDLDLARCSPAKLDSVGYMLSRGMYSLAKRVAEHLWVSPQYAALLVMIQENNEVSDQFFTREWDNGVLEHLSSASTKGYYGVMVEVLDHQGASPEFADVVYSLARKGFKIEDLAGKNYRTSQLEWVLQAYEQGLDVTTLLDPELSDEAIRLKYHELVIASSSKLSGRL